MHFNCFSLPGRSHFAFGLLGLAVVAAYLQATAMGHLVEAILTVPNHSIALGLAVPKNSAIALGNPKSAKGILLRNAFDSLTGPISDKPRLPDAPRSRADPLSAATCNDTKALIVTESVDPTWSMAVLLGPGETMPRSRRQGDDVAGKQVLYIGYNPRYQRPSVWLVSGAELCQSSLFAPVARPSGESFVTRPRLVAEKPLSEREKLFRSVRAVPDVVDGQVLGVRLLGIRPDSLLGLLGLKNGDRLENINGFGLTSVEKALEAYVQLRTLDKLKVQVNRGGNPMTIDYKIL